MKLYPIPGGDWAGTEADWKAGMKAKGLNPKAFEATKTREVPTGKKELMEFLTFFAVDVYRTGDAEQAGSVVDLDAMRALHNPGDGVKPSDLEPQTNDDRPAGAGADDPSYAERSIALDDLFQAAPVGQQLDLAAIAVSNARKAITGQK